MNKTDNIFSNMAKKAAIGSDIEGKNTNEEKKEKKREKSFVLEIKELKK
jgi:hypothetical protein